MNTQLPMNWMWKPNSETLVDELEASFVFHRHVSERLIFTDQSRPNDSSSSCLSTSAAELHFLQSWQFAMKAVKADNSLEYDYPEICSKVLMGKVRKKSKLLGFIF